MNMKTTYTNSFIQKGICIALTVSLSFAACNEKELLNPIPNTSLQADLSFNTPTRVQGQVYGIYAALKNGSYLGGRDLMIRDIRGEEFLNLTQNLFTGFESWAQNVNSGSNDALSTWQNAYLTINACNLFIDGMAAHPDVVSTALAAQYIAEAKFCRALSYHKLITMYAQPYLKDNGASLGVPLRLGGENNTLHNGLKRSTVAEIYTQILKDLDEAEADLPLTYTGSTAALLNTSRAHKNTAIALKTRVYLAMGNYAKVITEANKLVPAAAPYKAPTGVANALNATISSVFSTPWTTAESIFSMPMTVANNVGGQSSLPNQYNGTREYALNTVGAGILADPTIRSTDARKAMTRVLSGNTLLTKFPSTASPFLEYIPVIRYAEVMLNLAEASAKTGALPRAISLLQAIRNRSDATYAFPVSTLATSASLLTAIRVEKRIEFLGEGFRSDDLLRDMLTIPAKGAVPSVAPTAPGYVFPIPNGEVSNNPDL